MATRAKVKSKGRSAVKRSVEISSSSRSLQTRVTISGVQQRVRTDAPVSIPFRVIIGGMVGENGSNRDVRRNALNLINALKSDTTFRLLSVHGSIVEPPATPGEFPSCWTLDDGRVELLIVSVLNQNDWHKMRFVDSATPTTTANVMTFTSKGTDQHAKDNHAARRYTGEKSPKRATMIPHTMERSNKDGIEREHIDRRDAGRESEPRNSLEYRERQ